MSSLRWAHVVAAGLLLSALALGSAPLFTTLFQGTFDSSSGTIMADIGSIQIVGLSNVQLAPAPDGGKLLQIKSLTSEKVTMTCKFQNDTNVMTGPLTVSFEAILASHDSPFDTGIQADNPAGDIIPATGSDSANRLLVAGRTTGLTLPAGVPILFTVVLNRATPSVDWNYAVWTQLLAPPPPGVNLMSIWWSGTLPNTANVGVTGFRIEKRANSSGTLSLDDLFAAGPPQ